MIPDIVPEEVQIKRMTSRAFKIDFENRAIGEIIDGKEALEQAIRLALITKRYHYPIFSHSFGTDYKNASEVGFMEGMGIIKNSVCDSLMCDDRILSVGGFEFENMGRKIAVKFTVNTIYGDYEHEMEVAK